MNRVTIRLDDETMSFLNSIKREYRFNDISKSVRFAIDLLKIFSTTIAKSRDLALIWQKLSDKIINTEPDTQIVKNNGGIKK